jgi:hypothetical protein
VGALGPRGVGSAVLSVWVGLGVGLGLGLAVVLHKAVGVPHIHLMSDLRSWIHLRSAEGLSLGVSCESVLGRLWCGSCHHPLVSCNLLSFQYLSGCLLLQEFLSLPGCLSIPLCLPRQFGLSSPQLAHGARSIHWHSLIVATLGQRRHCPPVHSTLNPEDSLLNPPLRVAQIEDSVEEADSVILLGERAVSEMCDDIGEYYLEDVMELPIDTAGAFLLLPKVVRLCRSQGRHIGLDVVLCGRNNIPNLPIVLWHHPKTPSVTSHRLRVSSDFCPHVCLGPQDLDFLLIALEDITVSVTCSTLTLVFCARLHLGKADPDTNFHIPLQQLGLHDKAGQMLVMMLMSMMLMMMISWQVGRA